MAPRVAPPPPADPSADPSSPYFVYPSDGPSTVKVTPILTGANYHVWAYSMRRALGAKLKFEFLDGSIPIPADSFNPSYRSWNRCNILIHSWIMNFVDPAIAQSIAFMDNASDVWLDLKERFSQGDLVRVSELQQEIYTLTQDSRSVTTFYSELKTLWEELDIYMPIPTCSCRVRCSCDALRVARNNHYMLHVMRFLTGLNDSFNVVKSHIPFIDPLPSMTKIFSMVLQFKRQSCPVNLDDSKALVNASNSRSHGAGNGNSGSGSKRYCTYCHKSNHFVENCFQKHGVPPHMMKHRSGNSSSTHNAALEGGDIGSSSTASQNLTLAPSFTQDQYNQLLNLLQSASVTQGSTSATSNQIQVLVITYVPHYIGFTHTMKSILWLSNCPMEQKSLKMIGSGERKDGLYYLVQTAKDNTSSNHSISQSFISANNVHLPESALWHFR
ncbi:hypothetical protein TSUD_219060 [Trifolium subterraneum]|uniref:Retrotransposon Copia-like N-terminal domain-containing protein n=1 Tax=Trifolium subterraneum TaxID=3900 RepID=A0A2Z6MJ60_TRISU|nr:hypothetical protein TSUD_219060 [Trifolium subterraneum]